MRNIRSVLMAAIAASPFAMLASPASAQEEDFNVWAAQVVNIEAGEGVRIRLEAQERFTDDASRLGQLLLRPAIGYQVNDDLSVYGGYAYVLTQPEGGAESNEHRFFQEVTIRLIDTGSISVSSRNRLEQRTWEETDGTALRYRNQIALRAKISAKNNLVLYTEPFIGLNTAGFQRDGVGVWRNFVGISVPLGEKVSLTPGYLNQYSFRPGEDRSQHIANVSVSARF